jgi:two-component system OmpR family response regulator
MRVLVVEDDDRLRDLLCRALSREGYVVEPAPDGVEADYQLREFDFDAVVLDWMLPGPSGISICSEMRKRNDWTPVLMLTARDDLDDRVLGLDAGADDYLVKPFAFGELAARIRALIRRGKAPRPLQLSAGGVMLDPATRRVQVSDKDVDLTPKEFSLLEYLLRHKGEVVSRNKLVEHVWDFAYDADTNVVDVYVGYLRRKLGEEAKRLMTVRGIGYRIAE